ncbi:LuxR C-terminal-related transcriptional regulator [Streptomyces sp. NPDC004111]|uniref:LuxR C-terminal-related transcriptional regulator n=1 Tax=Streptomyces sp. NPDC004111 TaxID=3364690 RepID=UPI00368759F0
MPVATPACPTHRARPAPRVHGGRAPARPATAARDAALRRALRAAGHDPDCRDPVVGVCLVWLAGVLLGIARETGDATVRTALADQASATLAGLLTEAAGSARPAPPAAPLTRRELVVLRGLQEDVPLRRIADSLHVSHNTVRSQTRAVYRKLGVGSRAEALHRARELHLL